MGDKWTIDDPTVILALICIFNLVLMLVCVLMASASMRQGHFTSEKANEVRRLSIKAEQHVSNATSMSQRDLARTEARVRRLLDGIGRQVAESDESPVGLVDLYAEEAYDWLMDEGRLVVAMVADGSITREATWDAIMEVDIGWAEALLLGRTVHLMEHICLVPFEDCRTPRDVMVLAARNAVHLRLLELMRDRGYAHMVPADLEDWEMVT